MIVLVFLALLALSAPAYAQVNFYGQHVSNTLQGAPSNPTGTTNTTGVMMGLVQAFTPRMTGAVLITISGEISNSGAGNGARVRIAYGTGTAPANADALTGTGCGQYQRYTPATAAADVRPFSVTCIATGLTAGTAYWIDAQLNAVTGGTASITNVSVTAAEL